MFKAVIKAILLMSVVAVIIVAMAAWMFWVGSTFDGLNVRIMVSMSPFVLGCFIGLLAAFYEKE